MIWINDLRVKKFDALDRVIERKYTTPNGNTSWTSIGYYPSLEIAVQNLCI